VSLEEFHGARRFKIYIRLVKGDVIAYEMPSPAHSYVAGYLSYLIRAWSHYLEVGNELDMTVSRNTEYISDVTVEPMLDNNSNNSLELEAYHSQGWL
jgi:hypothetical protein